jgi:hypothetical protein
MHRMAWHSRPSPVNPRGSARLCCRQGLPARLLVTAWACAGRRYHSAAAATPHACRRRPLLVRSSLEGFQSLSNLLRPEIAAVFSAAMAVGSVGLNYYGTLLTERKRADLQKEVRAAGRRPGRPRLAGHAGLPACPRPLAAPSLLASWHGPG